MNEKQRKGFLAGEREFICTPEQELQQRAYDKFFDEEFRVIANNSGSTEPSYWLRDNGFYDHQVVLVPKNVLEKIYTRLLSQSITVKRGKQPTLAQAEKRHAQLLAKKKV